MKQRWECLTLYSASPSDLYESKGEKNVGTCLDTAIMPKILPLNTAPPASVILLVSSGTVGLCFCVRVSAYNVIWHFGTMYRIYVLLVFYSNNTFRVSYICNVQGVSNEKASNCGTPTFPSIHDASLR